MPVGVGGLLGMSRPLIGSIRNLEIESPRELGA